MKREREAEALMPSSPPPFETVALDWNPDEQRRRRYHSQRNSALSPLAIASLVLNAVLIGFGVIAYTDGWVSSAGPCLCELPTDKLFGHVPWTLVRTEVNDTFVEADPNYGSSDGRPNPWDDIFPSAWTAISDPQNITGGVGIAMSEFGTGTTPWTNHDAGFGLAVMHQVHCTRIIKKTFQDYATTGNTTTPKWHRDHCVEVLRQAVLCHGDLALEQPGDPEKFPQENSAWGNLHLCKDQKVLIETIRKHSILRQQTGWAAFSDF